jgi:hypothetical protein
MSSTPAHERLNRVVDHRLIVNGQELLAGGMRERIEPRSQSPREDYSLHSSRPFRVHACETSPTIRAPRPGRDLPRASCRSTASTRNHCPLPETQHVCKERGEKEQRAYHYQSDRDPSHPVSPPRFSAPGREPEGQYTTRVKLQTEGRNDLQSNRISTRSRRIFVCQWLIRPVNRSCRRLPLAPDTQGTVLESGAQSTRSRNDAKGAIFLRNGGANRSDSRCIARIE